MALPAFSTLFGVAMLLVGAVVCLVGLRHVRRAAALRRAPAAERLDAAPDGLVRVSGTVADVADPVVAPFSGVECVAFRVAVEERRPGTVPLPTAVTIHERAESVAFDVRTPHAAVPVAAPTRTVSLGSTTVAAVDPDTDPPERIARYERETDDLPATTDRRSPPVALAPLARALSLGRRRYSERRLSPGDAVTVAGRVRDGRLDPLVVSDASPGDAFRRLAKTSLGGVLIGLGGVALGAVLLVAG